MIRETRKAFVGTGFLAVTLATYLAFGIAAAVKVLGVACVVAGAIWIVEILFPPRVEGELPAFYFRGRVAVILGCLVAALGVMFLLYSRESACLLGWHAAQACG